MEVGEINSRISYTTEKIKRQVLSLESVSQPNPYQNKVHDSVIQAFENLDLSSRESALNEIGSWAKSRINTYSEYDDEFLRRIQNVQRMIDGKTVEQFQDLSSQMDHWDEILQEATSNLERFHINFDRFWSRMPHGTDNDNGPFSAANSKLEKEASAENNVQKQNKSVETLLKEFEEERQIYKAREDHYLLIIRSMQSFVNSANDTISALQKQQEDTSDELAKIMEEHRTLAKQKDAQEQVINKFLQKEDEAKQRLQARQIIPQEYSYIDLSGRNLHDNKLSVFPISAITIIDGNAAISGPNKAGSGFLYIDDQVSPQKQNNTTNSAIICDFPPCSNFQSQQSIPSYSENTQSNNNIINNNNNNNINNSNPNPNNSNNQQAAGQNGQYVAVMGNNLPDNTVDQAQKLLAEGNAILANNFSDQSQQQQQQQFQGYQDGQNQMQNVQMQGQNINQNQGQFQGDQSQMQNGQIQNNQGQGQMQGQPQFQNGQGQMQNGQFQGGQGQFANGQQQMQNNEQGQFQNSQGQMQNGQFQGDQGQMQNNGQGQFQNGQNSFQNQQGQMQNNGQGQFQDGQNNFQNQQGQMQNNGQGQFQNGQNNFQGDQSQFQNGQNNQGQFENGRGQMQNNGQNNFQGNQGQFQGGQGQFANGQQQMQNNGQGQMQNGQFQGDQGQMQGGQGQFQNGQNNFQNQQGQMQNNGQGQFQNGQNNFQGDQSQFQNGQNQFQNDQSNFQNNQGQMQGNQGQFQNGQNQIQNGQGQFQNGQDNFQGGQNQFVNGQSQMQNNQGNFQGSQNQFQNGQQGQMQGQNQYQGNQGQFQNDQQGQMQGGQGQFQGQEMNQFNGFFQQGDTVYDANGQPVTDPEQIKLYQQQQQQRVLKQQQQLQLHAFEQSMNQMQLDGLLTSDQQQYILEQMQNYILQNGPLTPEQQQQFIQQMLSKMMEDGSITADQQQQVMQQMQQAIQNVPTFGSNNYGNSGMSNMNTMNGMNNANGMQNMNGMNGMNNMNGMQNMNNMNGMNGMPNMNGMNSMNGMQNMNSMNGMNGMPSMNGMNNANGMNNMFNMNGINGMNNMNGMNGMNNMNQNGEPNNSEAPIVLSIPSVNGQPLVRTLSGEFLSPNGNPLKHNPVFNVINDSAYGGNKLLVPIYQTIPALVIHHYQAEYMNTANKSSTPKSRSLSKKENSGKQNENENPNSEENEGIVAMSGKQILVRTNPVTFPSAAYTCYDEYGDPISLNSVPTLFSQFNRTNRVIIQPRPLHFRRFNPIRATASDDNEHEQPPQNLQKSNTNNTASSATNTARFDVTQPSQTRSETPRMKMQKNNMLTTLPLKSISAINDALDEQRETYHEKLNRVMNNKGPENVTLSPRRLMSARGPYISSRKTTRESNSSTKMVPGEVQNSGIGLIITPFVHQVKKPSPRTSNQHLKPLNS